MEFSPKKINTFLFLKLPSAWWCGVRVKSMNTERCSTCVKYRKINSNPFRSMFWAVQGMAAELSTGALLMREINESKRKISMLVVSNEAKFYKKVTDSVVFTSNDGYKIKEVIAKAIDTGERQTFWMESAGLNKAGEVVSAFRFEWSVKLQS